MTGGPAGHAVWHADAAAEALRALNHATRPGVGAVSGTADVYDVLGALVLLTGRLPQVLSQLQASVAAEHTAGRIAIVDGPHTGDPAGALAQLSSMLNCAAVHATSMGQALQHAHTTLTWAARTPNPSRPSR